MTALKKKSKATKQRNHRIVSLIAHTAKMVAGTLRSGIQRKIEDVFGEDQFGFRKGTRDATGIQIISSERTVDMDEEVCACFVDWMKTFDCVPWTKLILILKGNGIDRRERKLISKLYINQSVKIRLDRRETRSVTIGGGDSLGWFLSQILFTLHSEYLTKGAVEGVGDFK
jgi:hypothetical protein